MRKFRNATIAGATAVALTFGATTVANASLSSDIGTQWEADKEVEGRALFGSTTDESELAPWAVNMRAITYAAAAASVFGLVVAPIYNYLAYNNILPLPKF